MKLVLVIASLSSGGAERVITDMANYWSQSGWDVSLLTISGDEAPDFYPVVAGVRRVRLGLSQPPTGFLGKVVSNLRRVIALRRAICQISPDAVISFIDVTNILTIFATRGLGLRVLVSERTDPSVNPTVPLVWRVLRKVSYRFSSCVVAQTETAGAWLTRSCRSKICIIPNPLRDLPPIVLPRELMVLSVGRLDCYKGHDLVLSAFAATRFEHPEWTLIILGEGPERTHLESLRDQLGLQGTVQFPGIVKDPEQWMARAGLVVQASRYEGFPNVILEAIGMGAAVISTNCPSGPSEIIEDGVNGRLVPVDDAVALARVMSELMGDNGLREMLGQTASAIRNKYAQREVMKQWNELLGVAN